MKKLIKNIFRKFGVEIRKCTPDIRARRLVRLEPTDGYKGSVLLSYIIDPFLLKQDEPISNAHHHDWLSWQIARTFLDIGCRVEVIDYRDGVFVPQKEYAFFIGARTNFQRIALRLNKDCIKIVHLDVVHWIFSNHAAYGRLLDLQKRKGVTLTNSKFLEINWAIEYADYATTNIGNQFNVSTYRYAQKPIFQIPLPTYAVYPWPKDKDFDTCRNHFLWFGSRGFVHKGLDLVLDAFAEMPDYDLTICGPIRPSGHLTYDGPLGEEKDFGNIYHDELYQTRNIHTAGWVDIESPKFVEITNNCIGIIFPSCSEGGGASVITCMQGGLIPIVSYESNVEVVDFGVTLKDCSIEEIKSSIQMISNLPAQELKLRARKTWEFARANHTREKFAEEYRKVIDKIIVSRSNAVN